MSSKSETKKLTLKRESLRELTDIQMLQVAGGPIHPWAPTVYCQKTH